jgi:hypothetical protein
MIRAKQSLHGKTNIGAVLKGEDGATFIPEIDSEGNLEWTNNKFLPNPEPINLKGPKGDTGPTNIPDPEQLALLVETDALPAMLDVSGAILADENGSIILRY